MEGFSNGGVPSFSPARDGSFACNIFFLRKWNKNPYVFLKSWSSRSFFICRRILSMSYTMKRIRSIWSSGKSLIALTWASSGWLHDRQLSSRVGRAWLSDVGTTAGRHAWHWQLGSFWTNKSNTILLPVHGQGWLIACHSNWCPLSLTSHAKWVAILSNFLILG